MATFQTGDYAWQSWSNSYVLELVVTEDSVDTASNTSTVSYSLRLKSGVNNRFEWTVKCGIKLAGESVASGSPYKYLDYNSTWELLSGTTTIDHDSDGSKVMAIEAWIEDVKSSNKWGPPAMSISESLTLTSITRPQITFHYYSNGATHWKGSQIDSSSQTEVFTWTVTPNTSNIANENHYNFSSVQITRTGYHGNYWGTSTSGGTLMEQDTAFGSYANLCSIYGVNTTGQHSVNLYAKWEPDKIKITLNQNGGSGGTQQFWYYYGISTFYSNEACTSQLTSISRPTRDGYTFVHYYGDGSSGGDSEERYVATSSYEFAGDLATDIYKDATLYAKWEEHTLTVNYYSNYADYGTWQGSPLDVGSNKNILVHSQVFPYSNTDDLSNVQNSEYLYLSRTGYTPTGYWGTSTNGGHLVNQDTSYPTGQAIAEALGQDITYSSASVNVYAQWLSDIRINFNGNMVSKIYFNNQPVEHLIYNGTQLF